jgi:hypothetical protein
MQQVAKNYAAVTNGIGLSKDQLIEENARLHSEMEDLRLKISELTSTPGRTTHHPTQAFPTRNAKSFKSSKETIGEQMDVPWEGVDHTLTKEQIERYSRQILLPSFGVKGTLLLHYCMVALQTTELN